MGSQFIVPDEYELDSFFGASAVDRSVEDGYWCYEFVDSMSVRLRFSFTLNERSVQTEVCVGEHSVALVVHEGAERMSIAGNTLSALFRLDGAHATLVVSLHERIAIEWSTLRTV
jgi:hypothetical protein